MDSKISCEERVAIAMEGRKKGYNCAQAVVTAFPDVLELPREVALRLSCGFGSGMGGMQKVCGVLSAMAILEGFRCEDGVMGKAGVYKVVRRLGEDFATMFGSTDCIELKSPVNNVPCDELIARGIKLYHDYLHSR